VVLLVLTDPKVPVVPLVRQTHWPQEVLKVLLILECLDFH